MGLFSKKEEKKVYLPSAETKDKESEEAKLKALEASLEFLHNPKYMEENKKNAEEKPLEEKTDSSEKTEQAEEKKEAPREAKNSGNTKDKSLTTGVKGNPVAPAVQPPSGKTLNPNAVTQETTEKKPETAPVPKPQETEEEAKTFTATTSMASKQWGRRMDYRTAVVKPQSPAKEEQVPTKPLAPTSVSNVPPAPRMPSNSLHTLNSQNSQNRMAQQQAAQQPPAKTIVPTVPEIPGKNTKADKPTVSTMNAPIPAQADNAPTIVAANADKTEIPQAKKVSKQEDAVQAPKPALPEITGKAEKEPQKTSTEESKEDAKTPEPALKPATPAPAATGMQKAMPGAGAEVKKTTEEKGLKAGNTGMIPNPLPTPKKHVPKEMDFDIQPPASQMHFDIVDMTGMDFFDIN